MRNVILLVFVQAYRAHQVDLDFVAGRDAADQILAALFQRLRHGQDRRNIVTGMAVIGGQERVVIIQFAHRGAIGPGRPFGADALGGGHAEHRGAAFAAMTQCHVARRYHRLTVHAGDRHRCVIDDAVDDHGGHVAVHRHTVGCDAGDLPGQLVLAGQIRF